jgi:hypothetical protein
MSEKNPLNPQKPSNPFRDGIENKSLESEVTEAKSADAAAEKDEDPAGATPPLDQPQPKPGDAVVAEATDAPPAEDTVEVVMIHHVNYNGEALIPGKPYTLPAAKANSLIASKRANAV